MNNNDDFFRQIYYYIDTNFSGYLGVYEDEEDLNEDDPNESRNSDLSEEAPTNFRKKNLRSNEIFKKEMIKRIESNEENETNRDEGIQIDIVEEKRSIEEIIKVSLEKSENRFLLFFLQNEFCKGFIRQKIEEIIVQVVSTDARVIFMKGSQLNFDLESGIYTKKLIKMIKTYIQLGYTILMEDLDPIYTILYDIFNQNFEVRNGKKVCKITYEDKEECFPIHPHFRCILFKSLHELQEEKNIEVRLPSPLLNRLEKHIIEFSD